MISFLLCLALLIIGYFVYGKIVDNTFGPDDRETPAVRINDGVDYVVMPQWKLFLVQLLNIAGLGPIFGALQGALWGPVVFLWITFGTIFAGGPAAGADSERWQLSAGTEPETRLDTRTAGQTHSARLYRPPQSGNGHDFPRAAAVETRSRFSGSGSHSAGNQGECSDKRTTPDFGAGLAGISAAYHCKTFAERSDYYTGRRFCSGSTGENYGIQML